MTDSRKRVVIVAGVAGLIIADQVTKLIAIATIRGSGVTSYLGDTFRFVYAENTGVFLGLGRSLPEGVRFWLFTLAVGLVLGLIFFDTMRKPAVENWKLVAITMILAGGLGNLVDRVIRDGVVVDFFNVADVLITTGAIMFLFLEFFTKKPAAQTESVRIEGTT
jgi:signal peptidase II